MQSADQRAGHILHPLQTLLQPLHIFTNLHVQNLRINHSLLQRPMTQHYGNLLNRHLITQRHGRSKRMPRNMKSQRLRNSAQIRNLLQVSIHLLITEHRQHNTSRTALRMLFILLNNFQRRIEQGNACRRIRFLAGCVGDGAKSLATRRTSARSRSVQTKVTKQKMTVASLHSVIRLFS
jgi:hypothetical protein